MMNQSNTRRGNTQTKTNSHAEVSLLSISSALTTQGGDPEQKLFRMTLFDKGAFTLIELLVVVLIIGILAAVALPQYNKAVTKARAVEVLLFLKNMSKNMDLFILQNGFVDEELSGDLDVNQSIENIQKEFSFSSLGCNEDECSIVINTNSGKLADITYYRNKNSDKWEGTCMPSDYPEGISLCNYLRTHLGIDIIQAP